MHQPAIQAHHAPPRQLRKLSWRSVKFFMVWGVCLFFLFFAPLHSAPLASLRRLTRPTDCQPLRVAALVLRVCLVRTNCCGSTRRRCSASRSIHRRLFIHLTLRRRRHFTPHFSTRRLPCVADVETRSTSASALTHDRKCGVRREHRCCRARAEQDKREAATAAWTSASWRLPPLIRVWPLPPSRITRYPAMTTRTAV